MKFIVATWAFFVVATNTYARSRQYRMGPWTIAVDKANNRVDIYNINSSDLPLFEKVAAQIWLDGNDTPVTSIQAKKMSVRHSSDQLTLLFTMPDKTLLIQSFQSIDEHLEVSLAATRKGTTLSSNRIEPLCTQSVEPFLPSDPDNRMLRIPWDNDAWVRFEQYRLNRKMDSFGATAIFNETAGKALVIGAIDHDTWKNAIHIDASNDQSIDNLSLISGFTSALSRDHRSHGTVTADTLRSARFVVILTGDWLGGMEQYAACCRQVAPQRTWNGGKPVGWNSWGVLQDKLTPEAVRDIGDFLSEELRPKGFTDSDGRIVLSLDSWWNERFDEKQIRGFVDYCRQKHFIPGLYFTPFADFATWDHPLPGIEGFTSKDIWLKVNGKPITLDGAYALDPTHPATQAMMRERMKKFREWGIEYLKCDFMSHGALEADHWSDDKISTGMQAYNSGMRLLQLLAGDSIYIDLSISPIFPYQYAHGRRIACDTYSRIDETQYAMNALTMGWWLDGLYFANDPDHLVLHKHDAHGEETIGENRARITSGVITGMYLCGDNFSFSVDRGFPKESRERAMQLLTNQEINKIPSICKSFRPLNATLEKESGAANLFTYETDEAIYIAAINYSSTPFCHHLSTSLLRKRLQSVSELWTGEQIRPDAEGIEINVPARDARIYKMEKKE
ncbi:MAG: alpha-galactosidase [Prevotella sp.]|nr:alpha-galactosidase [Prevotella sp.]